MSINTWLHSVQFDKIVEFITLAIENAGNLASREAGLASISAICKDIGTAAAPFMTPALAVILTAYSDKVRLFPSTGLRTLRTSNGSAYFCLLFSPCNTCKFAPCDTCK